MRIILTRIRKHRRRSKRNSESLRHNGPVSDASLESVSIIRSGFCWLNYGEPPKGKLHGEHSELVAEFTI